MMADGGKTQPTPTPPPPPPPPALPGAQSAQDSMRKAFNFAQGGNVKGVNQQGIHKGGGISQAGSNVRLGRDVSAKRQAKQTLSELRSMPSPKLEGLAQGGEVGVHKSDMEIDRPKDKKEKPWAGESTAGRHLREEDIHPTAHKKVLGQHYKVLHEMKSMAKPKLQGLASGGAVKGVHESYTPKSGKSQAGKHIANSNHSADAGYGANMSKESLNARKEHERVYSELKAMPKPKLQGLADGGEPIDTPDVDLSQAPSAYAGKDNSPQVPTQPAGSQALLPNGSMNAPGTAQLGQQANEAQRNVDIAKGKSQANIEQGYIDGVAQNQRRQQDLLDNVNKHTNDFAQYMQQNPIDPNHYIESKSTLGKATTALGLILGGFGGGANGGAGNNPAVDFLNKQIDRDIQAQHARVDQQKTILGAYQQLYGQGDAALAATKASMIDIYNHKALQLAAQLGTPQAQANYLKLQADMTPIRNDAILKSAGSLSRQALPLNNAGGESIQPVSAPANGQAMQSMGANEDDASPILVPGAQQQLDALRYQPKFKDQMPAIQEQYNKADQADQLARQVPGVVNSMQDEAKEGGVGGYMRRHDPLSAIPYIGEGLHDMFFQPFTDTQNNRSYDANKTRLKTDIGNALKGTNISGEEINKIVNDNAPEHGDDDNMKMKKIHNIKVFLHNSVPRGMLKDTKLSK